MILALALRLGEATLEFVLSVAFLWWVNVFLEALQRAGVPAGVAPFLAAALAGAVLCGAARLARGS